MSPFCVQEYRRTHCKFFVTGCLFGKIYPWRRLFAGEKNFFALYNWGVFM